MKHHAAWMEFCLRRKIIFSLTENAGRNPGTWRETSRSEHNTAAKYGRLFSYRRPRRCIQKYFVGQKRPIRAQFVVEFHRCELFRGVPSFRRPRTCLRPCHRFFNRMHCPSICEKRSIACCRESQVRWLRRNSETSKGEARIGLDESWRSIRWYAARSIFISSTAKCQVT